MKQTYTKTPAISSSTMSHFMKARLEEKFRRQYRTAIESKYPTSHSLSKKEKDTVRVYRNHFDGYAARYYMLLDEANIRQLDLTCDDNADIWTGLTLDAVINIFDATLPPKTKSKDSVSRHVHVVKGESSSKTSTYRELNVVSDDRADANTNLQSGKYVLSQSQWQALGLKNTYLRLRDVVVTEPRFQDEAWGVTTRTLIASPPATLSLGSEFWYQLVTTAIIQKEFVFLATASMPNEHIGYRCVLYMPKERCFPLAVLSAKY